MRMPYHRCLVEKLHTPIDTAPKMMLLMNQAKEFFKNTGRAAMRIAVCIKQIINPELPASQFSIDPELKRQKPPSGSQDHSVISSFDENAIEVALRIKDKNPGNTAITVFTVGEQDATKALKKALSMGADDAVLVTDPIFYNAPPAHIAHALALAINKQLPYDLILSGCVSGDWSDGVVSGFIAEILGMQFLACVTLVEKDENGMLRITRPGENGVEILESLPPLSVSIISGACNTPRYPKMKDIMAAGKKPIPTWSAARIGFNPNAIPPHAEKENIRLVTRETNCEMIPDEEPQEQAMALLAKLRERRAL